MNGKGLCFITMLFGFATLLILGSRAQMPSDTKQVFKGESKNR